MGVIRFSSGLLAQFHDAFTTKYATTGFEVHGDEGSLISRDCMTQAPKGDVLLRSGAGEEMLKLDHEKLYVRSVRLFQEAVAGRGAPSATGEDGVKSLSVALSAREVGAHGRDHLYRLDRVRQNDQAKSNFRLRCGPPHSRRRDRDSLVLFWTRLSGRGVEGGRRAVRLRRASAQHHDAASDRGRRHVGRQGRRSYRQTGLSRARDRGLLSLRPILGRAAGDMEDDHRRRDPSLQRAFRHPVRHPSRGRSQEAGRPDQDWHGHLRRPGPRGLRDERKGRGGADRQTREFRWRRLAVLSNDHAGDRDHSRDDGR